MAMLITKFHRLIQSRMLWLAFLVIVVFSFVIWGTIMPSSRNRRDAKSMGKLNGEDVSVEEYYTAQNSAMIGATIAPPETNDLAAYVRGATWDRLALLQEAKRLGVVVSDEEVAAVIRSERQFRDENGQFNRQRYENFVTTQLRITTADFERFIQHDLLQQKATMIVSRSVIVPPTMTRRAFDDFADRFTIEYAYLGADAIQDDIKVGEAEARALFDSAPKAFTLPEMANVAYIKIAAQPYLSNVVVDAAAVQAYYDQHIEEYAVTNDVAATTNLLSTNTLASVSYRPFSEVKDRISSDLSATLSKQQALERAGREAFDLLMVLNPQPGRPPVSFADAVKARGLTLETLAPFAEMERLPSIDAGDEFNRAVFSLQPGGVTDLIVGSNHVYVASLVSMTPSRVPKFEEVQQEVKVYALQKARVDALNKKAGDVRRAAVAAVKAGQSLASGVAPFKLTVSTTEVAANSTNEFAALLRREALFVNPGEVCEVIPTRGGALIARLMDRKVADPTSYTSIRPQVEMQIWREMAALIARQWHQDLLTRSGAESNARPAPADDASTPKDEPASKSSS